MLSIEQQLMKIRSVTTVAEFKGDGREHAQNVKLEWTTDNGVLAEFDPQLRSAFYQKDDGKQKANEAVTLPQPVLDALRFYANGHHYNIDDDHQQFDTVSGEPQNWLFSERDDDCTMIEDGSIAKAVLLGGLPGFEEPTEPLEGEVFGVAPGFELSQEFVTRASKDADAPDVIGNVLAASPAAPAQPCGDAEQADEAVSVDLIAKWARRMTLSLSDSECVALVQEILAARAKDRK